MNCEKLKQYDVVQIHNDLGPSMKHFPRGKKAIVIDSYGTKFRSDKEFDKPDGIYTLYVMGRGEHCWYPRDSFTAIRHGSKELLEEWEKEREKSIIKPSNDSKRYLSAVQHYCIAGRFQNFAKEHNVEWDDVCGDILNMVKDKDNGVIDLSEIYEEGYKFILSKIKVIY